MTGQTVPDATVAPTPRHTATRACCHARSASRRSTSHPPRRQRRSQTVPSRCALLLAPIPLLHMTLALAGYFQRLRNGHLQRCTRQICQLQPTAVTEQELPLVGPGARAARRWLRCRRAWRACLRLTRRCTQGQRCAPCRGGAIGPRVKRASHSRSHASAATLPLSLRELPCRATTNGTVVALPHHKPPHACAQAVCRRDTHTWRPPKPGATALPTRDRGRSRELRT